MPKNSNLIFYTNGQRFCIEGVVPFIKYNDPSDEEKKKLKEGEDGCKSFDIFMNHVGSRKSFKEVLGLNEENSNDAQPSMPIHLLVSNFFSGENHSNSQSIPDDRLPSKKRKFVEILN